MNIRRDRACGCDEITNLTMRDIDDLGSAIVVKSSVHSHFGKVLRGKQKVHRIECRLY
jgi:hypothetical protein